MTIVFTCVSSFALLAVALWFASERWVFSKTKGKKWLGDVLQETNQKLRVVTGVEWASKVLSDRTQRTAARIMNRFLRATASLYGMLRRVTSFGKTADSLASEILPTSSSPRDISPVLGSVSDGTLPRTPRRTSDHNRPTLAVPPTTSTIDEDTAVSSSEADGKDEAEESTSEPIGTQSPARRRFAQVGWQVVKMLRVLPRGVSNQSITAASPSPSESMMRRDSMDTWTPRPSRLNLLIPRLKQLTPTQYLGGEHQALVKHLQFSPNGNFLATCSWDRTTIIWKVGEPFTKHRVLAHPEGFVGQVAWSPNSKYLLCKLGRSIRIWTDVSFDLPLIIMFATVELTILFSLS